MCSIAETANNNNHKTFVCFPKQKSNRKVNNNYIEIGSRFSRNLHIYIARISGRSEKYSFFSTKKK